MKQTNLERKPLPIIQEGKQVFALFRMERHQQPEAVDIFGFRTRYPMVDDADRWQTTEGEMIPRFVAIVDA